MLESPGYLTPKGIGNNFELRRMFPMSKLSIIREFWDFLRVRKRYWLTPIIMILVLLSLLIVFASSSAVAPFIYTLF
jgi:hypothetical protein